MMDFYDLLDLNDFDDYMQRKKQLRYLETEKLFRDIFDDEDNDLLGDDDFLTDDGLDF